MQPRNNPLKTGRRRGHGVTNKNRPRSATWKANELPPAKTRNIRQTRRDVEAQGIRLGIGRARTPTQKRLNETPPLSAYRQGKRNSKRKPEVHRSKRNRLRMGR